MLKLDAGYFYGVGAFETILIKKGYPIFLNGHLKRLNTTLHFLQINKIITLNEVWDYLETNNVQEGVLKISVSELNTHFSIRKNPYTEDMYEKGFKLALCSFRRNETSPLTYYKTLNYAENKLAKQEAIKNRYNEALFLNTKGEICEGSYTNIFFIKRGKLYTPSVSCGLLPGTIRNHICTTENVKERIIKMEDLNKFDECFITNSVMGIMKVNRIENHIFGSDEYTDNIRKKYLDYLNSLCNKVQF